jgi:hypothetical protein
MGARREDVGEDGSSVVEWSAPVQTDFSDERKLWEQRSEAIRVVGGERIGYPRMNSDSPHKLPIVTVGDRLGFVEGRG